MTQLPTDERGLGRRLKEGLSAALLAPLWLLGRARLHLSPSHERRSAALVRQRMPRLKVRHRVIDVRDAEAFEGGHLARAVSIPREPAATFVARLRQARSGQRETLQIVYDADGSALVAVEAAMRAAGYLLVWYVDGGREALDRADPG